MPPEAKSDGVAVCVNVPLAGTLPLLESKRVSPYAGSEVTDP